MMEQTKPESALPCGHPQSALVGWRENDPGCTVYCGECAKSDGPAVAELGDGAVQEQDMHSLEDRQTYGCSGCNAIGQENHSPECPDVELPKRSERKLAYGRMMYAASDVKAYVDVAEATIRRLQGKLAAAQKYTVLCIHCGWRSDALPSSDEQWPTILKHRETCEKSQANLGEWPYKATEFLRKSEDRARAAESALAQAQEQIKRLTARNEELQRRDDYVTGCLV